MRNAGDDSVFVCEFTGTEFAMHISNSSNLAGFKIKIDDGEYYDVANSSIAPRILVSGLASGEHTIYIKPVSSSAGTAKLGIIGLYSRDETKATRKLLYGDINNDDLFDIRDLVCAQMIKEEGIDIVYNFEMADRNT